MKGLTKLMMWRVLVLEVVTCTFRSVTKMVILREDGSLIFKCEQSYRPIGTYVDEYLIRDVSQHLRNDLRSLQWHH